MVAIEVRSDLCSVTKEISLSLDWAQFAEKLYELTGVSPEDIKLTVKLLNGKEETLEAPVTQYNGTVGDMFGENLVQVSVCDTNEASVANALKRDFEADYESRAGFQLPNEAYERRKNSVLNWKRENKLSAFNPEVQMRIRMARDLEARAATDLVLGERCAIQTANQPERRGWLRFVGSLAGFNEKDLWCGVELDDPNGHNDGSYNGVRYFGLVKSNHGVFVKPSSVKTGSQFVPVFNMDELVCEDEL